MNCVGCYLSPEPLLQNPGYLRVRAGEGLATPTYAYANNNPLLWVDPDGLEGLPTTCGPGGIRCATTATGEVVEVVDAAAEAAKRAAALCAAAAAAAAAADTEQICQRHFEACDARGGSNLPGNNYGENRCASCKAVCKQQGWWPVAIPSSRGGRWQCPG
jgi:hypothetical protein